MKQWNYKNSIGCVNNNQTQPRFNFYKFLYWIVPAVFPVSITENLEKL